MQRGLYQSKVTFSLVAIQRPGLQHTTVKWPIARQIPRKTLSVRIICDTQRSKTTRANFNNLKSVVHSPSAPREVISWVPFIRASPW